MGYDIHITRKDFWADEEDPNNISLEEWKDFLKTQPDMRLDNYAEADLGDGNKLRQEKDGLAVWTSYSGNGKDGNFAWFYYNNGEIKIKNPDYEILLKICAVAKEINATVQGDDGEFYENGQIKADT